MCHHWRSLLQGLNGQWSALDCSAQGAGQVRCRGAAVAGRAGVCGRALNRGLGENQLTHDGRVSRGGLRSHSGDPLGSLAEGCRWSSTGAGAGVAGHLAELLLSLASLYLREGLVKKEEGRPMVGL